MVNRRHVTLYERRIASIEIVMSWKGLVFAKEEGLIEDKTTLSRLQNGKLKDPDPDHGYSIEHVWLVKGYRAEKVKGNQVEDDATLIEALVGEYRSLPNYAFLGKHNGQEFDLSCKDYSPAFIDAF